MAVKSKWKRIRTIFMVIIVLGIALFIGIRYYYPYGEGVKTGQLNFVVHKGLIFKTYEGKLIQSGYWSSKPGGIQSNEFNFSIVDSKIADSLMRVGGHIVELHYKEYFGTLPWRGYSKYIVDDIISVTSINQGTTDFPPVVAE